MAKLIPIVNGEKRLGYCFKCPACQRMHKICTADAHTDGWPIWTLTGTLDSPTIRASVLVHWQEEEGKPISCHSFITDGKIAYCGDSTHALSGQTVDLPEL